jgi:hypothetical protein
LRQSIHPGHHALHNVQGALDLARFDQFGHFSQQGFQIDLFCRRQCKAPEKSTYDKSCPLNERLRKS